MRGDVERIHLVHLSDALSFFVGKTVATLSEESGVPTNIVKRALRDKIARGTVERKGNCYRIAGMNAGPWRRTEP